MLIQKLQNNQVGQDCCLRLYMDAISTIVKQTDAGTPRGLRDRFFIMLLYDTTARVQEMVDIKLYDLQIGKFPIRFTGKETSPGLCHCYSDTAKQPTLLKTKLCEIHFKRR